MTLIAQLQIRPLFGQGTASSATMGYQRFRMQKRHAFSLRANAHPIPLPPLVLTRSALCVSADASTRFYVYLILSLELDKNRCRILNINSIISTHLYGKLVLISLKNNIVHKRLIEFNSQF